VSKKIDVMFFQARLSGGGAERSMSRLIKNIAIRNPSRSFVLCVMRGEKIPESTKEIVNLEVLSPPFEKFSLAFFWIIWTIIKYQPKRIFASQNHVNIIIFLASYISGFNNRLIISERAYTYLALKNNNYRIRSYFQHKFIPFAYKRVLRVHCVSYDVMYGLIKYYSIPSNKLKVIFNPIDKDLPSDDSNTAINNKPFFIFVGRLHSQKNLILLFKAFRQIVKKYDYDLLVLGDGPLRNTLAKEAKKNNLNKNIKFLGYIDNPYSYMQQSKLVILSSDYEGMPNVLLESISLERPFISTNCHSGPYEIVVDNFYGRLSKVGDKRALIWNIISTLEDNESTPKYKISNHYLMKETLQKFENFLLVEDF